MRPKGVILVSPVADDASQATHQPITALEPVANRPIVCHALDALRGASVREVAIAVPATAADEVQRAIAIERCSNDDVTYLRYEDRRGAATAMRSAAEHVGDAACIVHRADGLLGQPLAPLARPLDEDCTDLLLLLHHGTGQCLPEATRRMLRIAELMPATSGLGVAGVCLFGPGALRRACDGATAPCDQADLDAVIDAIATTGGRMEVKFVRGWRRYGGQVADLLELNRVTLDALAPEPPHPDRMSRNEICGRVDIHPTAHVQSSVIFGPIVIGPRATVTDSYIGPYTSIGADARVEGTELERSIVSAGASVMHIGGRLSGSVVGPGARVHRDFSLPRALRVCIGENSEVALP
jgi:glucose-1-phosphate thymidylyltransferase